MFIVIDDVPPIAFRAWFLQVDELLTKWHAVLDDVQYVEAAAQGVIIDMLGRTKLIPGREREEKRMLIPIPDTKARDEVLRIFSKQLENKKTAVKQFRRYDFRLCEPCIERAVFMSSCMRVVFFFFFFFFFFFLDLLVDAKQKERILGSSEMHFLSCLLLFFFFFFPRQTSLPRGYFYGPAFLRRICASEGPAG